MSPLQIPVTKKSSGHPIHVHERKATTEKPSLFEAASFPFDVAYSVAARGDVDRDPPCSRDSRRVGGDRSADV